MKVVLDVENSVQNQEIELTGLPAETFRFPVRGTLTNVLFDPDNTYLMRPPVWKVPESGG